MYLLLVRVELQLSIDDAEGRLASFNRVSSPQNEFQTWQYRPAMSRKTSSIHALAYWNLITGLISQTSPFLRFPLWIELYVMMFFALIKQSWFNVILSSSSLQMGLTFPPECSLSLHFLF